ncbi:hypothetical protein FSP39_019235 [Pinctada imbricata]|uniref:Innexin n=1 Tax=Pinctada imbricata TaxID=66713 RepID=A0AA89BJK4_PINIB|nr:hypothetical protein FSP39_019235 [Pinctada imbricata]
MNHIWTVLLLAIFAVAITSGQFMGNPIECWMPANFPATHVAYAKSLCWVSNTYYIPLEDTIPTDIKTRQEAEITYYQWVPVILLFQAFLFKFPNLVWKMCNGYSGLNMDKICRMADSTMLNSPEDRTKEITNLARYLNKWLITQRNYHYNALIRVRERVSNIFCFCIGKKDGKFLTGFYLFIKLLYVLNIVGQFFLLNAFMANDYHIFGLELIRYLIGQGDWMPMPKFPRVTLCDFEIRQLSNLQKWTVQCVLPVNMFNEKIFIFLWFWFFLLAILAFFNLFLWFYYILFTTNKTKYVRKYLRINRELNTAFDKKLSQKFAEEYLRDDGIFVLRIIAKNSSDMVVTDLVYAMWKVFKETHCAKKRENAGMEDIEREKLNGSTHFYPNGCA